MATLFYYTAEMLAAFNLVFFSRAGERALEF
jgi:hypothetical protein